MPDVPVEQKMLWFKVPFKVDSICLDVNREFNFCDGLNGYPHIDFVNPSVYEQGLGIPFETDELY